MASMEDWRVRRAIQHWSIVAFGLLIPAAAFLADPSDIDIPMNATLLSLVLLSSTAFELVRLYAWQDASALLCGLWSAAFSLCFRLRRLRSAQILARHLWCDAYAASGL